MSGEVVGGGGKLVEVDLGLTTDAERSSRGFWSMESDEYSVSLYPCFENC